MGYIGSHNTFILVEQTVYHGCVGLGTAHKEAYQCFGTAASLADKVSRTAGVFILAVTYSLFKIGLNKSLHHCWMRALHIIRIKVKHVLEFCECKCNNYQFQLLS